MTVKSIAVCPLSKLDATLNKSGAKRLLSLLGGEMQFERPTEITTDNHLMLRFNDIVTPTEGLVSPSEEHIATLIEFAKNWDWSTPLLIHCWAGISRSPAAAAIIALALSPDQDELELATKMRHISPSITPNIKMIEIADQTLQRSGKFSEAVRSIGRGEEAFEGTPFELLI